MRKSFLSVSQSLDIQAFSQLKPHHIGVATKSIESELPIFMSFGFEVEGEFVDEAQGVRGLFIVPREHSTQANQAIYRLELLENLPNSTKLNHYLKAHHKLYHIAFESQNIDSDSRSILDFDFTQSVEFSGGGAMNKLKKARMLVPIMEASYFSKLCFIMLPNRLLVELVELKPHPRESYV